MTREEKINFIKIIIVIGFTISVFYHYILSEYLDLNYYPYNTFLFGPKDKFNDFFHAYYPTRDLNPYSYQHSYYFPFAYIIMFFFTLMSPKIAFSLFTGIFILFSLIYVYSNLINSENRLFNTFVFCFMSYPVLFNIDRGNVESLLFVLLGCFIYSYQRNRGLESIFFLSLTIAMKLYTGVFIVLFLYDKKYKTVFYTALIVVVLTVISALILTGGIFNSFWESFNALKLLHNNYVVAWDGLQHNLSIYGAIKIIIIMFSNFFSEKFFQILLCIFKNIYFIFALSLFIFIVILICKKKYNLWEKVSILTISLIILPPVSFDYKLIHIFLPLFLFINYEGQSRYDWFYTLFFGLLLIPKDYYILFKDISITSILNPLIMTIMLFFILFCKRDNVLITENKEPAI